MDRGSKSNPSPETISPERIRKNHLDRQVSRGTSRREFLEQQARANAAEDTDPTPVEVPPFYTRPPTLKEELQRYVRYEVSNAASRSGFETFEEADDFGIDEDDDLDDWDSEYQLTQLQEENTMAYDNLEGVDDDEGPGSEEVRTELSEVSSVEEKADEPRRRNVGDGTVVDEKVSGRPNGATD